jgi:hypothetical protein
LSLSWLIFCALSPTAESGQDLDPRDVRTNLEQALPIAITKAKAQFPNRDEYILYSVHPRVFKGDAKGLHWELSGKPRHWRGDSFGHEDTVLQPKIFRP